MDGFLVQEGLEVEAHCPEKMIQSCKLLKVVGGDDGRGNVRGQNFLVMMGQLWSCGGSHWS